jgi:hypothetical protein
MKILLLILCLVFGSCAVSQKLISSKKLVNKHKLDSTNKFLSTQTFVKKRATNQLAMNSESRFRSGYEMFLMNDLVEYKKFDIVYSSSSSRALKTSRKLRNRTDYELIVSIDDKVVEDEGVGGKILRFITLGFFPQIIKKNVSFNYKLKNLKNNKVYEYSENYVLEQKYFMPLLFIPFDHNTFTPYFKDAQARDYYKMTKASLRGFFKGTRYKNIKK